MSLGLCTEKLKLNDKAIFLYFYAISLCQAQGSTDRYFY